MAVKGHKQIIIPLLQWNSARRRINPVENCPTHMLLEIFFTLFFFLYPHGLFFLFYFKLGFLCELVCQEKTFMEGHGTGKSFCSKILQRIRFGLLFLNQVCTSWEAQQARQHDFNDHFANIPSVNIWQV